MNGRTHLAAGMCAAVGAAAIAGGGPVGVVAAALGGLSGATLPDIDRRRDATYNHRSITHSALLAVPALVVAGYALPYDALPAPLAGMVRLWVIGFVAAYASHLALDAVTIKRIPLFLKRGPRFGVSLVNTKRTGGKLFQAVVLWGSWSLVVVIIVAYAGFGLKGVVGSG